MGMIDKGIHVFLSQQSWFSLFPCFPFFRSYTEPQAAKQLPISENSHNHFLFLSDNRSIGTHRGPEDQAIERNPRGSKTAAQVAVKAAWLRRSFNWTRWRDTRPAGGFRAKSLAAIGVRGENGGGCEAVVGRSRPG
jgi:hypothetical protein